jgi:hypothetical protein
MFCPNCKAEYRQGFEKCDDCNVSLVAELPPEPETEYVDYDEVFTTFNSAEIALMKSLLDSEDIPYFFHGETFVQMTGLAVPAKLMVKKDHVETAKELLKDLKLSLLSEGDGLDADDESEDDGQ